MSTSHKLLKAMSGVFGKSYFPDAPENINNADFQAGYEVGLRNEDAPLFSDHHAITVEWKRRGFKDKETNEAFNTWKRGYWSGKYTAICNAPERDAETQLDQS